MQKLFPAIFILFAFIDPIFPIFTFFLGVERDGIIFKLYLSCMALVMVLTSYFYIRDKKIDNITLLLIISVFGTLYCMTSLFYGMPNKLYFGQFLRWSVSCVPAVLMGIALSCYKERDKIIHYLPVAIILFVPVIAFILLKGARQLGQFVDEQSGLNYQLISYYMAQYFAISCYYLFIATSVHRFKIVNLLMFVMMVTAGIICMISGGRGGFILLCVYIMFLLHIIYKNGTISKQDLFILVTSSVLLVCILFYYFDLSNYAGFKRVIHPLAQNTGRKDDWIETLRYFLDSPIYGNGLGSDFYTWGFYSHNIIVDFLAETGIIGLCFFCYVFYWMTKSIYQQIQSNDFYVYIMIIVLYGLIMNCFSGYWISTWQNWFAFGVAFGIRCQNKIGYNLYR